MFKSIPKNREFMLSVEVASLYLKKSISSFLLFPLDIGYFHIPALKSTITNFLFKVPVLEKYNIKNNGRLKIFACPDDYIQELVYLDYTFVGQSINILSNLKEDIDITIIDDIKIIAGIEKELKLDLENMKFDINIEENMDKKINFHININEDKKIKLIPKIRLIGE